MEMRDEASSSPSSSSSSPFMSSSKWLRLMILVRGVPPSAGYDELKNHFERYGEVFTVTEMRNEPCHSAGKAATVVFADLAAAEAALDEREEHNHIILGKKVEVRRFTDRIEWRTVEVRNLPRGTTDSQLRDYFEKFAAIREAFVDTSDGRGCVIFHSEVSAHEALRKRYYAFNSAIVEVRGQSPWDYVLFRPNTSTRQNDPTSATSSSASTSSATAAPNPRNVAPGPLLSNSTHTRPNGAPHTPSDNRPISAASSAAAARYRPNGAPHMPSYSRPISATMYAPGIRYTPTPYAYNAPRTPFYNRPIRAAPYAYGAPYTPFYGTPYAYRAPSSTPLLYNPRSTTPYTYGAPYMPSYNFTGRRPGQS